MLREEATGVCRASALVLSLALAACTAGPVQDPAATPTAPALPAAPEAGPAVPTHVQALISLDEGGVRDLLGEPEFVWEQEGASMWRYRGQACFLDVFLYDGQGVTFVDVRGDGIDDVTRSQCFAKLAEAHASAGWAQSRIGVSRL